jgi:hypothetical protein
MASFGPLLSPTVVAAPRRKRQPRKLSYLRCNFCRDAKVKVTLASALAGYSNLCSSGLILNSVYRLLVPGRTKNAFDASRRTSAVQHLSGSRNMIKIQVGTLPHLPKPT